MLQVVIARITLALALLLAQSILIKTAHAAEEPSWPTKQMALVVPYPPGAITDSVGRRLGNQMSLALGVPVVIEN